MREFRLSGRGSVVASTWISAAGAPPEFAEQARLSGGYAVGMVAADEGPMITAQLVGFLEPPPPGTRVRAVIRRLYVEEGVVRYGFKFQAEGAEV